MIIAPQPGPQTKFLSTTADIAIYGGAAGGGKSWGLLMDPLRHYANPLFRGVVFRRTTTEITKPGAILDTARRMYVPIEGTFRESPNIDCTMPTGWRLAFSHLQHESDIDSYQGAELPWVGYDEATHFTFKQFIYLITRLRSPAGIKTKARATCNPDPDSWVKAAVRWWLDEDGRYADFSKSGIIRWFFVDEKTDEWLWFDTQEEIESKYGREIAEMAMSFTFIPARLTDNPILLDGNPRYKAMLSMQDKVTRARLRDGDWLIKASPGIYFKRGYFKEIDAYPELIDIARCWDRAATEYIPGKNDPDFTASVKMGKTKDGKFVICGLDSARISAHKVEQMIKNIAKQDTTRVRVIGYQDPGSAGKGEAERFTTMLAGYQVATVPTTNGKETNAKTFSAQAEAGNVSIWTGIPKKERDLFYAHLEAFPAPSDAEHDDYVDAGSGAFNSLCSETNIFIG